MSYEDVCCTMKEKADKFSIILRDLNTLNDDIKQKIDTLLNTLSGIKSTKQKFCTVCVSRAPTHCFLPCGHAGLCQNCAERGLSRNRCFSCRQPIESIVRIFI